MPNHLPEAKGRQLRALDRWLPNSIRQGPPETLRKARLLVGFCLGLAGTALLTIPILLSSMQVGMSLFVLLICTFFLGIIGLIHLQQDIHAASIVCNIIWICIISVGVWSAGGFEANTFMWFATVPLFSTFLLGSRWGYLLSGFSVVILFVFAILTLNHFPFPPPPPVPEAILPLLRASFFGFFMLVLIFSVSVYEDSRKAARTALQEEAKKNQELALERDVANASNYAKSLFMATMSHELRTPLNAIMGYAELMLDDVDIDEQDKTLLLVDYKSDIARIQQSGHHLLQLIDDVLDISRIESGKVELFINTFSLRNFLEHLSDTMQPMTQQNQNRFVMDVQLTADTMTSDQTKLQQCLLNLLSNANKFTEQGHITFHITAKSQDEREGVLFVVKDDGIGIQPEQQTHIFDKFYQGDASYTRKYGGTGLGLAITKELTHLLQGELTFESEWGKGSTFSIWLPIAYQKETTQPTSEPQSTPLPLDSPALQNSH